MPTPTNLPPPSVRAAQKLFEEIESSREKFNSIPTIDELAEIIATQTRCDSLSEQLRIADETSSFHMQLSAKLTQQNDSLSSELERARG
jgi:hypothetical protein